MKTLLTILLAASLCVTALAQSTLGTISVDPVQPWRVQCDPIFDASGTVASALVTVFFRAPIRDADGAVITHLDRGSVQWDAAQTGTVHVDGKTYTRAELLKAILADAYGVLATPPAAPETPPQP